MNILLYPEDTKAKRAENFRVPEDLLPYLLRYLTEIRPRLLDMPPSGHRIRVVLLVAAASTTLSAPTSPPNSVRPWALHDFRRAAATFLATDAPELIGLVPGVLRASHDIGEQYYNLARSVEASRRFATNLARTRARLRQAQGIMES